MVGRFPEQDLEEEPINDRTDSAENWRVSFYSSLKDANGVLLLGGRETVAIAGQVAIAFDRPVAAVAAFGGAAKEVWKELQKVKALPAGEHEMMGRPWVSSSADAIVASLIRRHGEIAKREQQEQDEKTSWLDTEREMRRTRWGETFS